MGNTCIRPRRQQHTRPYGMATSLPVIEKPHGVLVNPEKELQFLLSSDTRSTSTFITLHHPGNMKDHMAFKVRKLDLFQQAAWQAISSLNLNFSLVLGQDVSAETLSCPPQSRIDRSWIQRNCHDSLDGD